MVGRKPLEQMKLTRIHEEILNLNFNQMFELIKVTTKTHLTRKQYTSTLKYLGVA